MKNPQQPSKNPEQMRSNQRMKRRDFYSYSFYLPSLAAGDPGTSSINIQASANFVVTMSCAFADIAGAPQTNDSRVLPLITVAIEDGGSSRNLQSRPIPLPLLGGDAQLPFIWPEPRMIAANSTVTATFNNYSAATDYANIYLTFFGFQVFEL